MGHFGAGTTMLKYQPRIEAEKTAVEKGIEEALEEEYPKTEALKKAGDKTKRQIEELYDYALSGKSNEKRAVVYGVVDDKEAQRIKSATGFDVSGYKRVIDNYAIRHILKRHGDPQSEARKGNIAVTKEDFLLIPEIVSAVKPVYAGKTSVGRDGFKYEKKINGYIYVIEEVRTGRQELVPVTLYKKRVTAPGATSQREGVPHTSETFRAPSNKNIPQSLEEVNRPTKDANRYQQFIENKIKEGVMDPITPRQRQKLIETYKEFPLYQEVTTKLGEKVKFTPPENKSPEEYVHHFLTKYSKHRNKELFSGKYLQLIKEIPETIQNHDDRILGEVNGQDRIYYIREFRAGKRPPHLVVVTVDGNGNLIGWTHFETNKAYIKRLEKREKELIEKRGLIDKEGNPVDWGYDEYLKNKRSSVLYLGSTAVSGLRRSQEPPPSLRRNIPQSPEEVKGSAEESVVSDMLSRESGEEGYILIPGSVSFKKFWTAFKEFWQPLSTMPESEKYLALRYKAYGDIDRIENFVKSLWDKTKKFSPEVKRKMFLYLYGKIGKEELPHEARLLANSIRERLKTIGRMLVKRGLLSEETFEKHKALQHHPEGRRNLYIPYGSNKTRLSSLTALSPSLFISHMVQIKRGFP